VGPCKAGCCIHCEGRTTESGARGNCTLSGVLSDSGRFVDKTGTSGGNVTVDRIFFGAKGTIRALITIRDAFLGQVTWKITKGTKAYAGLRGKGKVTGGVVGDSLDTTMLGTVSQ
jgi:hypothetical protein